MQIEKGTPTTSSYGDISRLLASDKPRDIKRLREWRESAPPPLVYETTLKIAGAGAANFPVALFFAVLFVALVGAILVGSFLVNDMMATEMARVRQERGLPPSTLPLTRIAVSSLFPSLFTLPIAYISGRRAQRAALRAVEWLAEVGDNRALCALATVWNPWAASSTLAKRIEPSLERMLSEHKGQLSEKEQRALISLLKRSFPRFRRPQNDFTDISADVIMAAMRCLSQSKKTGNANGNKEAISRVANFPVPANAPNRALIQSIAQTFLLPETPMIPLERPVSSVAAETLQTASLRRRV